MSRKRNQSNANKAEVTLMTLLAFDSSSVKPANKLLQKYGKPAAKSRQDLEQKLTELYIEAADKIQLEKEMADIHPHKDWLLKYVAPVPVPEPVVIEPKIELPTETKPGCGCGSNCPCKSGQSYFDGPTEQKTLSLKSPSPMEFMGIIGLVAVVGITFYVISKKSV